MEPLTESEIRAAFVNCSKGEAKRLSVPRDLASRPWADLDYLGWRDPQALGKAYLTVVIDGRPSGLVLRCPSPGPAQARRSMCSMCLTTPVAGVALMVAPMAGAAGRQGNTVGTYICGDLACSLYVRGKKDPGPGGRLPESISVEERADRLVRNVTAFVKKIES
jgi:hypothetical protein